MAKTKLQQLVEQYFSGKASGGQASLRSRTAIRKSQINF